MGLKRLSFSEVLVINIDDVRGYNLLGRGQELCDVELLCDSE